MFDSNSYKYSQPKNTFLEYGGKLYPAKFIRKLSYEVAFNEEIGLNDFSGGGETEKFFEKLGFKIKRFGIDKPLEKETTIKKELNFTKQLKSPQIKNSKLNVVHQKNALQKVLQKKFGLIETEKKFDWLKTPFLKDLPKEYINIYNSLLTYCKDGNVKEGFSLPCDFYFDDYGLLVEYDERQHFSIPRKITLENYPNNLKLNFSREKWINTCDDIRAKDGNPPGRDNIRAFYDCVRDIEISKKREFKLVRVRHGDFDWEKFDHNNNSHVEYLDSLINYTEKTEISNFLDFYDWRSLEVEFQRIKLNHIKWIYYFNPPTDKDIPGCGSGNDFLVFKSGNGRSFSCSPSSAESVYCGGGKGCIKTAEYFNECQELRDESSKIKRSLKDKIGKLRELIKIQIKEGNYKTIADILENYFWIKVCFHEFVQDSRFKLNGTNELPLDSREYILESLSRNARISIDKGFKLPNLTWNKHACCAFDSGPIALGKNGYVPYSEVVKTRANYFYNNPRLFEGTFNRNDMNKKRECATDSLSEKYDFLLLYYKGPMGVINSYQEFKANKKILTGEIERIQDKINEIIDKEKLNLEKYYYIPR